MFSMDFGFDFEDTPEEIVNFSKHLLNTKFWFTRISYANKKGYLLVLLQDVRSAWTLSLLLKSIWNCRLKDAVMSQSEPGTLLSSYDQVPMDHNRTAVPVGALAQTMKNDRIWFLSLSPEPQAYVLAELLTVSGGPVMWEVLRRARTLYERYQDNMLQSLNECIVLNDSNSPKIPSSQATEKEAKKNQPMPMPTATTTEPPQTQAKKDLEANLAAWNSTIKSLRDALKLEEVEMTFHDGTKRKIWKVNRPKPDVMESIDFVQLLPSWIGKKILSYLPRAQLGDYARVNKYWAYLVDEYRAEIAARVKINADFEKLKEYLFKHDEALDEFIGKNDLVMSMSDAAMTNIQHMSKVAQSVRASEKSGCAYSLRHFSKKMTKPMTIPTPIRNMTDFSERLERRGAADENIWKWCENVLNNVKALQQRVEKKCKGIKQVTVDTEPMLKEQSREGLLTLGDMHFPCPMMKEIIQIPLKRPLYADPAKANDKTSKQLKKVPDTGIVVPKGEQIKRYRLWSRNLSSLYRVFMIPSHQFPA